ncbi:MAG: hypothetical protein M1825_001548 [Sarcosagium campestre]|nr:MAG: hypothetical protein M1825_001548 [Sarcosagium campestre]
MKLSQLISSAIATTVLFSSTVFADVDPIVIKGTKFFYKTNGTEFYIKGVAYQEDYAGNGTSGSSKYTDPLADADKCRRDVPLLAELQTNTIRVYAIDPSKDHDECMNLLQDAGIYVISDLSQPDSSINREDPAWDVDLWSRYAAVIDSLAKYNNVIGFFAGNEVSNAANNTAASPFVKAAVRDMKTYIKQRKYRPMGVGYATSDDDKIRDDIASYFDCGSDDERIDFYGYNVYSWCGKSSFQESGYKDRTDFFQDYTVPVFFAEYGCNQPQPRRFDEVQALYGKQMTPVWSGGIVYMYFQEANDYGLVKVDGDTASKLPDFTALSSQLAKITPSSIKASAFKPTNTKAPACPTGGSWNASADLPPSPNEELCECAVKSFSCVAKADLDDKAIARLFASVCDLDQAACDGIGRDGSRGDYGSLSMCRPIDKLSWAFNTYYENQKKSSSACDFRGNAEIQNAATPSGNCGDLLRQVGARGTGQVTTLPSATGNPQGASGASGSRGSSSASSSPTNQARALLVPGFDVGSVQLGAYMVCAMLTGAGMILL